MIEMDYEIKKIGKKIPKPILDQLVQIHEICFPDDASDDKEREIIFNSWNNPPIMQYWVASTNDKQMTALLPYPTVRYQTKVVGYVRWVEHGGIRPNAVIELEQIAVHHEYQERGIAPNLIDLSLEELANELKNGNRKIKLVYVSTGDNNSAQKLYKKTLGAEVDTKIHSFYEDSKLNVNELIMLARIDKINEARKNRGLSIL